MIVVLFEVEPKAGAVDTYLDIAAELRPMLEEIEGFISVERFQSLTTPGKYLSYSVFEDEAAVARWREMSAHRAAQGEGRAGLFDDYRIRVAQVLRDYGLTDRAEVPS